jgi:hypothetical protein
MKLLQQNEQIEIENVEQFKAVYRALRNEWSSFYTYEVELGAYIENSKTGMLWYVAYGNFGISVVGCDPDCETITFDEFMSRVTPPLNFWKWAEQNAKGLTTNENIEEYVQYRFEVGK